MPAALWNCRTGEKYKSKEDMIDARRMRDNKSQKIKYWRKTYGYDLKLNDYEDFKKNVKIIKSIHKIHDFVCNWNPNVSLADKDLDLYASNYKKIKAALPIQPYLRSLTKLEIEVPKKETESPQNRKIIVSF